jgi:hypothetical protein
MVQLLEPMDRKQYDASVETLEEEEEAVVAVGTEALAAESGESCSA